MSGPSGHPGVTLVPLTSNLSDTTAQLMSAYAAGAEFKWQYQDETGRWIAVLVTPYRGK